MTLMRRTTSPMDFWESWRKLFDTSEDRGWMSVEEMHDGSDLIVRAELPGVDPDKDVEISLSEGVLHIRAERQEKSERKDEDGYRSEFRYGSFSRDIPVPAGAKPEDVGATYENGILEVRVPIAEEAKPAVTKVPITKK